MKNFFTRRKIIFFICSLAYFVANLDSTIVNVALPAISSEYKIDIIATRNILIVFSFAYGLSIPLASYLSDKYGVKTVFMFASFLFGLSSIMCGFSHNVTMLEIMRGIQGASGAFFTPVARSIIVKYSSKENIITTMANILSFGLVAQTIGPFIGGQIINYFSWRWIFFINIPVCLLIMVLSHFYLKNIKDEECHKLDLFSFINVTIAISLLLYFFEYLTNANMNLTKLLLIFLAVVVSALVYCLYSTKRPINIINTMMFKNKPFRDSIISSILIRQGIGSTSFILVIILSMVYNLHPVQIGNIILFYGLGIWVSKFMLPKLLSKFDPKEMIYISSIGVFLFILSLILLVITKSIPLCIIIFILGGMAQSIFLGCNNGVALMNIDKKESNQASTIISLVIYMSQSSSISILSVLFALSTKFNNSSSFKIIFSLLFLNLFVMVVVLLSRNKKRTEKIEAS